MSNENKETLYESKSGRSLTYDRVRKCYEMHLTGIFIQEHRNRISPDTAVGMALAVLHHDLQVQDRELWRNSEVPRAELSEVRKLRGILQALSEQRNQLVEKVEEQAALLSKFRAEDSVNRARKALTRGDEKVSAATRERDKLAAETLDGLFMQRPDTRHPMVVRSNTTIRRGTEINEGETIPISSTPVNCIRVGTFQYELCRDGVLPEDTSLEDMVKHLNTQTGNGPVKEFRADLESGTITYDLKSE